MNVFPLSDRLGTHHFLHSESFSPCEPARVVFFALSRLRLPLLPPIATVLAYPLSPHSRRLPPLIMPPLCGGAADPFLNRPPLFSSPSARVSQATHATQAVWWPPHEMAGGQHDQGVRVPSQRSVSATDPASSGLGPFPHQRPVSVSDGVGALGSYQMGWCATPPPDSVGSVSTVQATFDATSPHRALSLIKRDAGPIPHHPDAEKRQGRGHHRSRVASYRSVLSHSLSTCSGHDHPIRSDDEGTPRRKRRRVPDGVSLN